MIYVGIDDTDTLETPGTNQLAKEIAQLVADRFRCLSIVRHQLFFDPRVPYTSKNGSASICFEPRQAFELAELIAIIKERMLAWYVVGSDPGLCVTTQVPAALTAFGQRAKEQIVTQAEAHALAAQQGIYLEGLGGTCGGVIGALAAVGLIVTQNDGRVVRWGDWPDDLSGVTEVNQLRSRNVFAIDQITGEPIERGLIDVGKHLRPNLRNGRCVVFAERNGEIWQALKLV